MPVSFATFDTVPSRFGPRSRVALALAHAAVDAETQQQDIFVPASTDYVDKLIKECANAWGEYMGHPFPKQLADDKANLNGFRHYTIQDSLYLEHYYRFRTEAVSKTGTLDEIKQVAAKLSKSLDFVISFRDDCTDKLGVPKGDVTGEAVSQALKNSIALHKKVNETGDWLDVHIVLLPCILGYDVIASKLLYDPQTVRNAIYYPLWVQANTGGSSSRTYRDFINKSIGNLSEADRTRRWPGWVTNFTDACGTEKAFFDLGIPSSTNTVPAYKVVTDGTYKIRNYRNNHFLVSKTDSSVITKELQADEGKWKLTNATATGASGYTIESVSGKTGSLSVTVGDLTQPIYQASVSQDATKQQWPINTAVAYDNNGKLIPAIQIFVPGRSEFVLDAGRNVADPKVFVANNSQISSQLWLLDPAT